jgi:hypothetical protein
MEPQTPATNAVFINAEIDRLNSMNHKLTEENKALRAEVEKESDEGCTEWGRAEVAEAKVRSLQSQLESARANTKKVAGYAAHQSGCSKPYEVSQGPKIKCKCGLDALLSTLTKEEKK